MEIEKQQKKNRFTFPKINKKKYVNIIRKKKLTHNESVCHLYDLQHPVDRVK